MRFGVLKGKVKVGPEFDAPLEMRPVDTKYPPGAVSDRYKVDDARLPRKEKPPDDADH